MRCAICTRYVVIREQGRVIVLAGVEDVRHALNMVLTLQKSGPLADEAAALLQRLQ